MPFQVSHIVPWGRSYEEYVAMFELSDKDLRAQMLGCGDGPASFNVGLTRRGGRVISVDPLYSQGAAEIRRRIDDTFPEIMREARRNQGSFVWSHIRSVEELGRTRMSAMLDFLADYPEGKAQGRYVTGALPRLTFADNSFELAVCSHLLFLYSNFLDLEFHLASLTELCRVAREVRVFPLLQMNGAESAHLAGVLNHFRANGYEVDQRTVSYEFQRGGNQLLVLSRGALK